MAAKNDDVDFKMLILSFSATFLLVFIVRIYWVLVRRQGLKKKKDKKLVKTMIVMGSGLINIYIIHPFVCVSVSL
jgi:preprotein translocase subunit YajC